ncbi:hypothetical protein IZY60_02855 [Lutibacter sp. B2]|nr:hypothetical protein [Lutibacter sp. B2]
MRNKIIVIIASLILGFSIMAGGYGSWQHKLIIKGNINFKAPPPPTTNKPSSENSNSGNNTSDNGDSSTQN